jgi:hypothetical protein
MICHATAFPFSLSEYIKRQLGMHESYPACNSENEFGGTHAVLSWAAQAGSGIFLIIFNFLV